MAQTHGVIPCETIPLSQLSPAVVILCCQAGRVRICFLDEGRLSQVSQPSLSPSGGKSVGVSTKCTTSVAETHGSTLGYTFSTHTAGPEVATVA